MKLSVLGLSVFALMGLSQGNRVNYLEVEFTGTSHYGNPVQGCLNDELPIRIQGLNGGMCTSDCTQTTCPTDLPESCDAKPQCVLENRATHKKYCALMCTQDSHCGVGASCEQIQPGVGLCTYA